MSEVEITTEEPTVEVAAAEPQGNAPETDWKAEARKWENRAKAAKVDSEAAAKWREYEEAQKPIQERMAAELAQTKAEASQATAELLRYKIASEKGIAGEATKLLKGSTQEEIEAEADLLLSLIANQSKPKTPMPDENQGKPANATVGQLTEADLKNMSSSDILKAKAAGQLDDLLGKH
jgi:hypothetical protein